MATPFISQSEGSFSAMRHKYRESTRSVSVPNYTDAPTKGDISPIALLELNDRMADCTAKAMGNRWRGRG